MSTDRAYVRRRMAHILLAQLSLIVFMFSLGLLFDEVADRVPKVWPPFAVIIPSYIAWLINYTRVGADETKAQFSAKAGE